MTGMNVEKMHMVFRATNNDGLALELGQDASNVTMQFLAEQIVTKK